MSASVQERSGQRGVSRVLLKLENSIDAGNYYEAHQMYRTLYFRYIGQRKYVECLELLWNGALRLIDKQQETSGADLALLLLDTLEKRTSDDADAKNDGELWIQRLGTVIGRLHPTTVERETLINRAILWSSDMSGKPLGHPTMHKAIAQVFFTETNYEQARHHFLLSHDGYLSGRCLVKMHLSKGYESEVDLFIVQAVLQQLCLKDRKAAEDTFKSYTASHPSIRRKEAFFKQPLLNFLHFLFRAIDTGRPHVFNTLRDLYKPSLKRDPSLEKYLLKIGVHYFGIAPRPRLNTRMFGDLLSRIFDDDDDEGYIPQFRPNTNTRDEGASSTDLD